MSLKDETDISKNIEGLLPLENIYVSQANLRQIIIYRLSHANNFLKYIYYTEDNPLICNDILNDNEEYIDEKLFDEEIRDKVLFFDTRVPTDDPAENVMSYFSMNLLCKALNKNFGEVIVEFDIIIHQELLNLYNYTNRIDMICIELMKLFNHKRGQFLGTLEFSSGSDINVPERYRGYRIIFKTTEFNR